MIQTEINIIEFEINENDFLQLKRGLQIRKYFQIQWHILNEQLINDWI